MRTEVVALRHDTPLYLCALRLLSTGAHSAPVMHGDQCVGVLSATDLLSLSAEVASAQPDLARLQYRSGQLRDGPPLSMHRSVAAEAMASPAVTVRPDLPVSEASRLMLQHGVHMLPVTSSDADAESNGGRPTGSVIGVVTRTDVLRSVVARATEEWLEKQQGQPPGAEEPVADSCVEACGVVLCQRLFHRLRITQGATDRKGVSWYSQVLESAGGGGYELRVKYGRVGEDRAPTTRKPQQFTDLEAAMAHMDRMKEAKLRAGYAVVREDMKAQQPR
jgi:CBS domain-containing protein/predicted DNA-binding WGR domain protein